MPKNPCYQELEKRVQKLQEVELQLRNTENLLKDEINWRRLLVEESRDGIVVLDRNVQVYEANNRFSSMLGYSMEEVRHLHAWDWDARLSKE